MKKLLFILIIGLISLSAQSQSSGLKLLEIGPTPVDLARSEASVASANGAASIHSNPALLVLNPSSTIDLGYTSWIQGSNNLFGGINLKNENRAVAFSFYSSGISGFEQRNAPGESNGDFSIQYVALSGAYSYNFKYITAGVAAHYINEEVYPYRATGYAFNAGLAGSLFNDRLALGAALLNSGKMEKLNSTATTLPTTFNFGLAMDVLEFAHPKNPDLPILATLMADFVMPLGASKEVITNFNPTENYLNLGLSLTISETLVVSTGYKTQNNARPLSFGIGLLTEKVVFNYALIPFNTGFGTVHSIGLQYQL
jgi:hypothetical protein